MHGLWIIASESLNIRNGNQGAKVRRSSIDESGAMLDNYSGFAISAW